MSGRDLSSASSSAVFPHYSQRLDCSDLPAQLRWKGRLGGWPRWSGAESHSLCSERILQWNKSSQFLLGKKHESAPTSEGLSGGRQRRLLSVLFHAGGNGGVFSLDRSRPTHVRQKAGRGRGTRATGQINGEDGRTDAGLQPPRTWNESAEWGEGWLRSEGEQGGGLTLEVKSLLVHSDGECAVVLVIDSYHSPLDKWSGL